jgi:hypothetical protein
MGAQDRPGIAQRYGRIRVVRREYGWQGLAARPVAWCATANLAAGVAEVAIAAASFSERKDTAESACPMESGTSQTSFKSHKLLFLTMELQMQLYWKVFGEVFSTDDILKNDFNPVYRFDDQLVDGAIIDIGCGQTSPLIQYADLSDRRLIGIDNEAFQLKKLRSRMTEIARAESEKWELITVIFSMRHCLLATTRWSSCTTS